MMIGQEPLVCETRTFCAEIHPFTLVRLGDDRDNSRILLGRISQSGSQTMLLFVD